MAVSSQSHLAWALPRSETPAQDSHKILDTIRCTECRQARAIEDLAFCKLCGQEPGATKLSGGYYCIKYCFDCFEKLGINVLDCQDSDHVNCWESHLPRRTSSKYQSHVKCSAADDMYIRLILYSEIDRDQQMYLHHRDREREWFRVTLAKKTVQGTKPTLQVSHRFKILCGSIVDSKPPSFVSFVGDTGVGKSTLVRAMIMVGAIEAWKARRLKDPLATMNLQELVDSQTSGPVTRSSHIDLSNQPTSVGVHLYKDPNNFAISYGKSSPVEDIPVLFADCEGFRGSTSMTDAESGIREFTIRENKRIATRQRSSSTGSVQENIEGMDPSIIIKDCDITAPDFANAGKESAELFYARFLYAFSDIVVFVTSEDQRLHGDMQRLLEWSATAMAKSIVQKSAKTLIIVVNSPKQHFDEWYDPDVLKAKIFRNFGLFWQHSQELKDFVTRHNDSTGVRAEWIHDNESLFEKLFQDVKMCYIPKRENAAPDILYGQYVQLRRMINSGTQAGQRVRSNSFDLYNVTAMSRLLDKAFDHFANSKRPFDFYTAARRDSPTPVSIPGHIAVLMKLLGTKADGLARFVDNVACCMLVYTWRSYDLGREPVGIFKKEIRAKCKSAMEIYQENLLQCQATVHRDSHCILQRVNHGKEHCDDKGQRAPGGFFVNNQEDPAMYYKVLAEIQHVYVKLYHSTFPDSTSDFRTDKEKIARLRALRQKVYSMVRLDRAATFDSTSFPIPTRATALPVSAKTCLACLQFAPDHVLSCGHMLCTDCVKDFGVPLDTRRYCYRMQSCILCGNAEIDNDKQDLVQLDSRFGGARILTLDGGGIRGIVELAILEKIMKHVAFKVPIRELFDLVVGTSTGGIVALALTMADPKLTLEELQNSFLTLAEQTFQYDRLSTFDFLDILPHGTIASVFTILKWIKSRYDPERLRTALQVLFAPERPIFGDLPDFGYRKARVAVTSTSSGAACAFSNYSRYAFPSDQTENATETKSHNDDLIVDNGLLRSDDPTQGFRIWQAAMATAAAPLYFPPFVREEQGRGIPFRRSFVDGALHSNSPVEFALKEKDRIWPADRVVKPVDILVAVGTGYSENDDFHLPRFIDVAGSNEVALFFKNTIDSEKAWQEFCTQSSAYDPRKHHRLNIVLAQKVQLDEWRKMKSLIERVDECYNDDRPHSLRRHIETTADQLVAALFFYEPQDIRRRNGQEYIAGQIWCRLDTSSEAFRFLISRVQGFYSRTHSNNANPLPCTFKTGEGDQYWTTIKQRYLQGRQLFALPYNIRDTGVASFSLSVVLNPVEGLQTNRSTTVFISGFPTTFNRLRSALKTRGLD